MLFIGDRLFTDIVLANRMGALAIWTKTVWDYKEGRVWRIIERSALRFVERWSKRDELEIKRTTELRDRMTKNTQ